MGAWANDVEVLLAASPSLQPPLPWLPVPALAFDWAPSVLVVGRNLLKRDREVIQRSGVLEFVPTIQAALTTMADAQWDIVVVSPAVAHETDGLGFVRAFKVASKLLGASAGLDELRVRYARTPFLVQPLDGDTQFAIFHSAQRWFLGNTWAVPLAQAILQSIRRRGRA